MDPGKIIGQNYEIQARIGGGGMAEVFRARHLVLGSLHAVKILHPHLAIHEELRQRFLREGRIQAQLRHPHLVLVTDVISEPGIAGLVMELLQGEDLSERLAREQPDVDVALEWMRQLLEVLAFIHERGVIHRDIKPANLFLQGEYGQETLRLTDFGIAQEASSRQTQLGVVLGTPAYMPPEQRQSAGQLDHRADLFAAGAVLYELLLGHDSWGGVIDEASLSGLPAGLQALLRRALAPVPDERFASAQQFASALQTLSRPHSDRDLSPPLQTVALSMEINPCVTLAAWQNAIPVIHALHIKNLAPEPLDDVTITLEADPPIFARWSSRVDRLLPDIEQRLEAPELVLHHARLRAQTERERVVVTLCVVAGDVPVAYHSQTILLLAPNEWPGAQVLPDLLAAFVQPNEPALRPILGDAARRLEAATEDASLSGYQSRSPQRVKQTVRAIYESVQATGITYINPPASFEDIGQKVRLPEMLLDGRQGTCLDLTVLLAALLEQIGLHPLLIVVKGHIFPGVWLTDFSLQTPILDDPVPIVRRAELDEVLLFDSSAVTQKASFSQACGIALAHLARPEEFRFVLDVYRARVHRIQPLSLTASIAAMPTPTPTPYPEQAFDDLELPLPDDTVHINPTTRGRLERWKGQLLDLSLRNRLLNFQETKGSFTLSPHHDVAELFSAMRGGAVFSLRAEPAHFQAEDPRAISRADLLAADVQDAQHRRELTTTNRKDDSLNTLALEIHRQTRAALQESGAITLYLTLGMLQWFESASSEQPRLSPLVLVPIELLRPAVGQPWRIQKADSLLLNTTLLKKLEADFKLVWSGTTELSDADDTTDSGHNDELAQVFRQMKRLVFSQPRWAVDTRATHISRFSFTKFLMWRDLEARMSDLEKSPIVRHLLQTQDRSSYPLRSPLVETNRLDARDPKNVLTTLDADPTQLQAIFAAEDGNSFVLQGPPGTGKSQTITNMVSALLGQGKSVLFVSEKMAALDVVYARLSRVGLGAFCLKLHSDKSNKKEVIHTIAEALLEQDSSNADLWEAKTQLLATHRQKLNAFADLLKEQAPFGETLFQVISQLIRLRAAPRVPLQPGAPSTMTRSRLMALRESTTHLQAACLNSGAPAVHPWSGVGLTSWTPALDRNVHQAISTLLETTRSLQMLAGTASGVLRLPPSDHVDQLAKVAALSQTLLHAPAIPPPLLSGNPHEHNLQRIQVWSAHVERRHTRWNRLASRYTPELLQADLSALHLRFQQWAGAFFLFAFFMLWSARRQLRPLLQDGKLPENHQIAEDLETAILVARDDRDIAALEGDARGLLGFLWRGIHTDTAQLQQAATSAGLLRITIHQLTADIDDASVVSHLFALAGERRERIGPGTPQRETLERFLREHEAWQTAREALRALLKLGTLPATLSGEQALLQTWMAHPDKLRDWTFLRASMEEARRLGLAALVDALEAQSIPHTALEETFERSLYEWWYDRQFEQNELLRGFRGQEHEGLISRFRALDVETQALARAEIQARLRERLPDLQAAGEGSSEAGLLRRQLQLSRKHMPLRKLFHQIPQTLRRLKPCMLMSPLSVAQYLDPALERFDVVIFDEASQIPPWDALGAIARGNQVVIVGDSKQLPPTSFFSSTRDDDDDDDDEDMVEMESILEETAARMKNLRLKWHYRSQHESLITFSNRMYYENELFTFPSAARAVPGLGVEWRHVANGYYDRGRSRTNLAEAEAVVAELHRLLTLPASVRPTVGIVTFSMPQQRQVEDLVDALRMKHPELDAFFGDGDQESVFIKNLENVQGDERDVMLFSICYGPDRVGKVAMNFGPLNRQGGERRLNVAITRARQRLVVFSTLRADQIDPHRTRSIGVKHLKSFLSYAAGGETELSISRSAETESPFEEAVRAFLERNGWEVHCQIGCSGYRIDLGVVDPRAPGRYLLGVECDGATYHSSSVARERDRLRQSVLESLGWKIHRVWSTDWWLEPAPTQARLLQVLANTLQATVVTDTEPSVDEKPADRTPEQPTRSLEELLTRPPRERPAGTQVFSLPSLEPVENAETFYELSSRPRIAHQVLRVVEHAGPIHQKDVIAVISASWGFGRAGKRIQQAVLDALGILPASQRPILRGEWLWPSTCDPATWEQFRISDSGAVGRRDADRICTEEVANAAGWVVDGAKNIDFDDLALEVAHLFGFTQRSRSVRDAVERGIEHLVKTGKVVRAGSRISVVD